MCSSALHVNVFPSLILFLFFSKYLYNLFKTNFSPLNVFYLILKAEVQNGESACKAYQMPKTERFMQR